MSNVNFFYNECKKVIPNPTKEHIEKFSLLLVHYQNTKDFTFKAGVFLSSLINKCKDRDITIHTQHLGKMPKFVGTYNADKHITVKGDVGNSAGYEMKGGLIHVMENAMTMLGHRMYGGVIQIDGNVSNYVGYIMKGGKIYIKGEFAGNESYPFIDQALQGGEIHIEGDHLGQIPNLSGGTIYHKQKALVYEGKKVKPFIPFALQKLWIDMKKK